MKIIIDGLTAHTPTWDRGIGKVVYNLLEQMLFQFRYSEVIIIAFDASIRQKLPKSARAARIHVIDKAIMERPYYQRAALYAAEIGTIAGQSDDTVFWHPNPLMLDQILPYLSSLQTLVTSYDYIPWRNPALYIDKWPDEVQAEYTRRLQFLKSPNVHIATISETVADQTRDLMPLSNRIHAVPIGIDDELFVPAVVPASDARPYVVLVSGDDPRKNITRFVTAVCEAIAAGWDIDLKIVCHLGEKTRRTIVEVAAEYDCTKAIEVLGYVSDYRLAALLRGAAVAAMPSFDEGFGLPIIEALSCGVPVISSDIPTSREVGDGLLYYFDPSSTASIVGALVRCLEDGCDGKIDKAALIKQASTYNWQSAGDSYCDLIRHIGHTNHTPPNDRPNVALLTPWPPQRSGIAGFAEILAPYLNLDFNLVVVVENLGASRPMEGVEMIAEEWFEPADYDILLCQLGNNVEYHTWIYGYALLPKSIAIVHDTFIHPFLQNGCNEGKLEAEYLAMLEHHFHADDISKHAASEFKDVPVLGLTGLSDVIRKGGGLLVHNRFGYDAIRAELGENAMKRVAIAPLVFPPLSTKSRSSASRADHFVLGMFGHLTPFKLPFEVIAAVGQLIHEGFPVELRIIGDLGPMEEDILKAIDSRDLGDHVLLIGFASDDAFFANMNECDVIINLRHPTLGETSAVVYAAMHMGRPAIVSDNGSFSEFPDEAVVKVPATPNVRSVLADRLRDLMCNPEKRQRISDQARRFTHTVSTIENYRSELKQLSYTVLDDLSKRAGGHQ